MPVGVKDIFDSEDHPTQFFSPIYADHQPSRDAHAVTLLREAGALIMGKTHTTEFAYMHTGPTRNPHDLDRTPGSSSAGSAAGMAADFFAVALVPRLPVRCSNRPLTAGCSPLSLRQEWSRWKA